VGRRVFLEEFDVCFRGDVSQPATDDGRRSVTSVTLDCTRYIKYDQRTNEQPEVGSRAIIDTCCSGRGGANSPIMDFDPQQIK